MYPSSNYNTSFCYENHSKRYQDHYHPPSSPLFYPQYTHHDPFRQQHHTIVTHVDEQFVTVDARHLNLENNCSSSKRTSKKDRHSKINTARGPRDRRMRLSLDVAKKFFRLQDELGFDKASNTIKWLLMKSEPAIRDLFPQQLSQSCSLMGIFNSASSSSECEVLSGFDDQSKTVIEKEKSPSCCSNKEKKSLDREVYHSIGKEAREKARARARKRTSEKRNKKLGCSGAGCQQYSPSLDQVMNQNVNRLGSRIPFGENQVPSSHFQFKQGVVGANASNWSSSSSFSNYPGPSYEHQLSDFGQPWEGNKS